jgi:aspartate beta-hydroxylase
LEGCKISVGGDERGWKKGKCITFDDSFEHEVVHGGEETRVVLMFNFWHPELSDEKERVKCMEEFMQATIDT